MTTTDTDYRQEAADDAADTIRNFADEILEQLLDNGEASDDLLNNYPNGDSYHHENHVDKWYSLIDAAELIDQLSQFEETDSGLWAGQQPKEAIGTCAAFTYGNAVYSEWRDLIEKINEEASDMIDAYNFRIAEVEDSAGRTDARRERNRRAVEKLQAEKKAALEKLIGETADNA